MELGGSPREALVRGKAWVRLRCVLQEVVSRGTPGKSSCWRGVAGGRPGAQCRGRCAARPAVVPQQMSADAWGPGRSPWAGLRGEARSSSCSLGLLPSRAPCLRERAYPCRGVMSVCVVGVLEFCSMEVSASQQQC